MPVCAVCPIAAFSSQPSPTVLLEAFANVPDPRKRKGRIHPLPVILGLAACSNAAGHTTPTEIGEWCRDAPQQLLASLGARYDALTGMHLAPSRDTVARVLAALEPDLLDCALGTFLATLSADTPETNEPEPEHIALDGKVLRGSRGDGYPPVMLISAYAPARGAILAQREVNAKSNEIPEAPRLLETINLVGKVVTADALHTQNNLAHRLRQRGAHYALTVKANRPKLKAAIADLFTDTAAVTDEAWQIERARGQVRLWHTETAAGGHLPYPGAAQAARITRYTLDSATGLPTAKEVAYIVTSLPPHHARATRIAGYIRAHWTIENQVHYVRDVTFHEDACRARTGNLPRTLASLRNLAISVLRHAGWRNIASGLRKHARNPHLIPALLHLTESDI